jgi:hypothetical protein
VPWDHEKCIRDEQELRSIEDHLEYTHHSAGGGYDSTFSKDVLIYLEVRYRKILEEKEAVWRQKSRAIWLANGDEKTKFFQDYAKGRKYVNTIWNMKDQEGRVVSSFEGNRDMFAEVTKEEPS